VDQKIKRTERETKEDTSLDEPMIGTTSDLA
jgi:hypothetical protein